jgi:GPH family glycoside/pentoside/hexuronide:cation symporter
VKAVFITTGTILAAISPGLLSSWLGEGNDRLVYRIVACVIAFLLLVLYTLLLLKVKERPDFVSRPSNPLIPGVRRALRNGPFRVLFFATLVSVIPASVMPVLLPFYIEYVIQPENPELLFGASLLIYLTMGMLFLPLWLTLARRLGKLVTLLIASTIGIVGSVCFFFLVASKCSDEIASLTFEAHPILLRENHR